VFDGTPRRMVTAIAIAVALAFLWHLATGLHP
jgi:hypothetical protein